MHSGRFIIVQKHFVIITEVPPSLYRSADFPRGETFRTNEPDQYPLSVTHFPYETHNECEASNFSMARPKLRSSFRANARPPVLFRRRPLCQNSGENLIPCMMSFQAMPRHQDVHFPIYSTTDHIGVSLKATFQKKLASNPKEIAD
jgi:hypothetical protein